MAVIKDVHIPNGPVSSGSVQPAKAPNFWEQRARELKAQAEAAAYERDLDRLTGHVAEVPASGITPMSQDEVKTGTFLMEMLRLERAARDQAEASRNKAEEKVWEAQAKYLNTMIENFKQEKGQATTPQGEMEVLTKWMSILPTFQNLIKPPGPEKPAMAVDPGVALQLKQIDLQIEQMRQQHEERMEELRAGNAQRQREADQRFSLLLEEAKDRRVDIQLKLKQLEMQAQQSNKGWSEFVGALGDTVSRVFVPEGGDGNGGGPRVAGQTPSGMRVYQCDSCGFSIPVSPSLPPGEAFYCPKCKQGYKLDGVVDEDSGSPN
jgi:hypothetical protein